MLIKDITVLNSNMEPLEHRNVVVKDGRFDSIGVDVVETRKWSLMEKINC